jgi:hypothetical protein
MFLIFLLAPLPQAMAVTELFSEIHSLSSAAQAVARLGPPVRVAQAAAAPMAAAGVVVVVV